MHASMSMDDEEPPQNSVTSAEEGAIVIISLYVTVVNKPLRAIGITPAKAGNKSDVSGAQTCHLGQLCSSESLYNGPS